MTFNWLLLNAADVGRLIPLGTRDQVEFDRFAFIERSIAIFLDRGKVHEYIFSSGPLDKAVPFRSVKPLHCSLLSHSNSFRLVTQSGRKNLRVRTRR